MVVKLGTGVLTDSRKQPDLAQLEQLVAQIAAQRKAGKEVAYCEMLLSGITSVADLSGNDEGWLDLAARSGLRVFRRVILRPPWRRTPAPRG